MSKQQYYEAHITMQGDKAQLGVIVGLLKGWKFSAIDGDSNLGDGVKCYATRQMNTRLTVEEAQGQLLRAADYLKSLGANVLRRKIELVLWDDRISAVACTAEECASCPTLA